jgi:hypothetical protein
MKVMLKDAPGARDFVNLLATLIEDTATAVTGKPDDEVRAHLEQMSQNLKRKLAPLIGAEAAKEMAEGLCGAVMGEKHERETLMAIGLLL